MSTPQLVLWLVVVIFVVEALSEIVFAGKPRPAHAVGRAHMNAISCLVLAIAVGVIAVEYVA